MECPGCQIEFEPTDKRQKYCTPKCGERFRSRRHYLANQTEYIQRQQDRANADPEAEAMRLRKWRATNRSKMQAFRKKWRKANPDKVREAKRATEQTRRARRVISQVERIDPLVIFDRDDWTCRLCGLPVDPKLRGPDMQSASLDHAMPLSKGGSHTTENLQLAHLGCNIRKRDN